MRKDNLGDRMKSYENITRTYLPGRMPKNLCDNYRNVIETYLKEEAELRRI